MIKVGMFSHNYYCWIGRNTRQHKLYSLYPYCHRWHRFRDIFYIFGQKLLSFRNNWQSHSLLHRWIHQGNRKYHKISSYRILLHMLHNPFCRLGMCCRNFDGSFWRDKFMRRLFRLGRNLLYILCIECWQS
jgi:hypothetical protein